MLRSFFECHHWLCAQVTAVADVLKSCGAFCRWFLAQVTRWATFQILLLYFITASDCRNRCLRFLFCKVLVVSLIIDLLGKSLREKIFEPFFWVFSNQFLAHVSAGSNVSCSFRALYFWSCAQVTAGSNVLGSFSAFCYKFCQQVSTGANVWRFLAVKHIFDFVQKLLRKQLLYFSF